MKTLFLIVLFVLAIFGLSEFLHTIKLFFVFPKRRLYSRNIVDLKEPTAEKQLRYVCEQYKWYGKSFADFIVFNTSSIKSETCEKCKEIARKYGVNFDF